MARVNVLNDVRQPRHVFAQHLYKFFHMRHHGYGRDDTNHDLTRMNAGSAHNMTDNSRSPVFIIGGNLIFLHPLTDDRNNFVIAPFLNRTGINIDNAM